MKKKLLSVGLAAALLSTAVLGLSSCGNTDYFYCNANLDRYVSLPAEEVLGLTLDLPLPYDAYTEEDARRELEHQRLIYATYEPGSAAEDAYLSAPGYGDTAYVYFELAKDAAFSDIVTSNLYSEEGAREVLIGYWQFKEDLDKYLALFDNEAVSNLLTTLTPSTRRTDGLVMAGDVLRVSYSVKNAEGKSLDSYKRRRVDLSHPEMYEASLLAALADAPIGVEQKRTVQDEKLGALTYTFTVDFAAEEHKAELALDLPKDTFDDTYREEMQALNGQRVYLRLSVDAYLDFTVPQLDRAFLTDTLKFNLTDVSDAELVDRAVALQKTRLENERLPEVKEQAMLILLDRLEEIAVIKRYPDKLYREHVIATVDEITEKYWEAKQAAVDGKYKFNVTLDQYAAITLEYELAEYPTLQDYARANAEQALRSRLTLFAMADICGQRVTKSELDKLYADYVDSLTDSAIETLIPQYLSIYMEKEKLTEAQALEKLGGTEGIREKLLEERGGYDRMRESVITTYGGREDLLWYTLLTVTYGATKDHIFAGNTWNYRYLGEPTE